MLKPIGQAKACRIRRIEHLIDQEAKTWDEATLRRYFHNCDVEEILKIKLPTTAMEDWVAWRYEKSFVFTIRSAYRHAMRDIHDMGAIGSSSSREGERTIRNKLWSVLIPSKVKVLAWKIVKNGILIRANQIIGIWTRGACVNYAATGWRTASMQSLPAHMQEPCALN
jgi:hypothetical protein